MSPVGFPETPDRMKPENIEKGLDGRLEKKGLDTFLWLWNDVHFAPFEGSRAIGFLSYSLIRRSVKARLHNMSD